MNEFEFRPDVILDNVTEDKRFLKPKGVLPKRAANRLRSKMHPTAPNAGQLDWLRALKFRLFILSRQTPKKR